MNNLDMPTIYGTIESSSFLYNWVENGSSFSSAERFNAYFPLWNKFWNPQLSHKILSSGSLPKFIYALRVCKLLRSQQK